MAGRGRQRKGAGDMLFEKQRVKLQKASIRYIIFIYFTLTALAASIFIGISLYSRLRCV